MKAIPRRETAGPCPVSFGQELMWLLDKLTPGISAYNVPRVLRIKGDLNIEALRKSLDTMLARHAVLRTNYVSADGIPMQVVNEGATVNFRIVDLSAMPPEPREAEAQRISIEESDKSFDLERELMMRTTLLRLAADEHILILVTHHIASDGESRGIFFRELAILYGAFSEGKVPTLPDPPIQYADFAVWQRESFKGEALQRQLQYWLKQLSGAPPVLELPSDRPRPAVQTYSGARMGAMYPKSVALALRGLSQQEGATQFMLLLTAFNVLLHRYTGQDDIVVGTPVAGRSWTEVENLIGYFSNSLVLRTKFAGNPTFRQLLKQVREMTLGAFSNQELPFEKLVEELQPERDLSRSPIYQIMFSVGQARGEETSLRGLQLTPLNPDRGTAKFDLSFGFRELPEGLSAGCEYATDLFDAATFKRFFAHLGVLLEAIAANPDLPVDELPLLTETERHQLLAEWNDTHAAYPRQICVHELVEKQAARVPENVALVFEGRSLTYRELNGRANQLARLLQARGVRPDVQVAILVERSLEMIIAVLGILKAGAAFAPLDPAMPKDRLSLILAEAKAPVVLTLQALTDRLPETSAEVFCLDHDGGVLAAQSDQNPGLSQVPDSLAYVIYTSGSTGVPKGVMVSHANLVNAYFAWEQAYQLPEVATAHLQMANYAFDVFSGDFVRTLCSGAKLVLCPLETLLNAQALYELMRREKVDCAEFVPAVLRNLIQYLTETKQSLDFMRLLIAGSDVWYVDEYKNIQRFGGPKTRLINSYGLAEATIDSTYFEGDVAQLPGAGLVPIGRPFPNSQIYILDERRQLVPVGVTGELCISGPGLARGYLNRPDLTAEKFIPHPFSVDPGARLYRTGDVARYRPDGTIEFLGRSDHQVKIRGFRIELGEIEAVLNQHPQVRQVVVIVREDTPGDKRLTAYLVTGQPAPALADLRAHAKQHLPDYMVPAAFVFLDKLPLTNNGKLDRKALPAPDASHSGGDFLAPRSALELELKNIWEEILGVKPIGIADNFFEIGGHSLLAVKLFIKVEQVTGKKMPLATLFQAPTIEQFAEILHRENWTPTWNALVAIQPSGSKTPLFLVHGVGGNILNYQALAKRLAPDQPVYALQSVGMDGKQSPLKSVEEMATEYIKEIRGLQPQGPYYLGGMSFGGMVIWEMAQQLAAQGEQIGLLAMLDVAPWGIRERLSHAELFRLRAVFFFDRVRYNLIAFLSVPWREKIIFLQKKKKTMKRRLKSRQWQREYVQMLRDGHNLPPGIQNVKEANFLAAENYEPQPFDVKVTVFRGIDKMIKLGIDPRIAWRHLARGGVELHEVPGDHLTLLEEPNVQVLVKKLRTCLAAPVIGPTCVHQFFEEQARRTPDATAVINGETTLSYHELNERADQLAAHLRALGIGPDTRVGLCAERSIEMIVAVLGILKAGGAYVPMDFAYPKDRLRFMLEDSRAPVLLTQRKLVLELPATSAKVVFLDEPLPTLPPAAPATNAQPTSASLAYVIYTSGSTGQPKGVAMPHRSLVNLIEWQRKESQLPPCAKTLQFASLSFDVSFQEMFSTWAAAGTLVLITEEMRHHPGVLLGFMQKEEVARLFLPFVALQHIAQAVEDTGIVPATLREVVTAGEQLQISPAIQNLFQRIPEATLYNHYGPSETHVVTSYRLEGPPHQWMSLPPIGRPIPRVKIIILDPDLKPVKDGEPGELHVGGVALAQGYLDRPELTREAFIQDPHSSDPSARWYKTGDLARWLPDGNLEFLGRKDNQVKLRGFRIELGEIETVLGQHPKVRAAAVSIHEPVPGDKRLVAYVVGQPSDKPGVNELRAFLGERLADYMIPTAFVPLEALPLTPSGKVDRRSLPAPDQTRPALEKEFVAPRDKLEQDLKAIWEQVLGVKPVGIRDNFFELGGHSLLAARLFTLMEKATNRKLPLAILFQAPTIETCAELLRRENWLPRSSALVPLQAHGSRPPLFLVHGVGGNVLNFRQLAKYLGEGQPFYGLQSLGLDGQQAPLTEIEEMAQAYLRELRVVQPHGPYRLGGMSFGGMVAWEMARKFVSEGEKVELLALLDVDPWGAEERLGKFELIRLSVLAQISSVTNNLRHFAGLPFGQKLDYLRAKKKTFVRRVRSRSWQRHYMKELRSGRALPPSLNNVKEANFFAEKNYRPQPYSGHITVFVATDRFVGTTLDTRVGWQGLALGGVTMREVPGDHLSIVEEPHVQVLAAKLKQCLDYPPG
ncbi:MAG: amino acid adenylation domain-containing protein [Verrucomicrobia bacterium]|nr:amino acid adenylation domain-containing protein [Verrucomicrobiota bacterium]